MIIRELNLEFGLSPSKNNLISKLFTKEVDRNQMKNYLLRISEYSKWTPDNFELYFGSIPTISIHKNICKSTFSPLLWSMQFCQRIIFILIDSSKCKAHSDMKSGMPMEFKNMQKDSVWINLCYFHKLDQPNLLSLDFCIGASAKSEPEQVLD